METINFNKRSLERIQESANTHPLWENKILKGCESAIFNQQELFFIFCQHYWISDSFSRILVTAMARFENNAHRAELSHNLWEESGEGDVEECHALLLQKCLSRLGDGAAVESIQKSTDLYLHEVLDYLNHCKPAQAAAFLSWGVEGIVPRLYSIFIKNLAMVGLSETEYRYFSAHVECDDGHAEVLQDIALSYVDSYKDQEHWMKDCLEAVEHALTLREQYFSGLDLALSQKAFTQLHETISNPSATSGTSQSHSQQDFLDSLSGGEMLYRNSDDDQSIRFCVKRLSVKSDVMDPRVLSIEVGARNEMHMHAHESLFYVVEGQGELTLGDDKYPLEAGDVAYVPRWVQHSTRNTGNQELKIFAVTDFGLTKRLPGNTEGSYRQQPSQLGEAAVNM